MIYLLKHSIVGFDCFQFYV